MAIIAILIIGVEAVLLYFPALIMRFAIKYSKFNLPMALRLLKSTLFLFLLVSISCANQVENGKSETSSLKSENEKTTKKSETPEIILGANRTAQYLPLLLQKRVGIVGNQSSLILAKTSAQGEKIYTHLVDSLLSRNINIAKVLSPEHGFRGTADAGEQVTNGKDDKTGLPIISLYGKNKKPTQEQLQDLDILVFDIQDVGVRFYTYLATMHYVMQAAAEAGIPVIILDRPNPNGSYIDGPVMQKANTSFLGMHAGVPLAYGMTIGEYAKMINGEDWLGDSLKCDLTVIQMENYNHDLPYSLPVRPSPNLPNDKAINLYPSLGLLEGTKLNAGRGTDMQFQVIGSPYLPASKYPLIYTPEPNFGSKDPKFKAEICHAIDLRETPRIQEVHLDWIIDAYKNYSKKAEFFDTANFTVHAGTDKLQQQIEAGLTMDEIRNSWQTDLDAFKKIRKQYLIYL
ncbi:MAG: DUF1343 domain-containing protein [Leeuwenhoekiella sp.]